METSFLPSHRAWCPRDSRCRGEPAIHRGTAHGFSSIVGWEGFGHPLGRQRYPKPERNRHYRL